MISDPGLTLTIYAAEPASPTAHALALLASWTSTDREQTPHPNAAATPRHESPWRRAVRVTLPDQREHDEPPRESVMRVRMTLGDRSATATLADNPTARDFASLLPVTLSMSDLFGLEKPGTLPRALDQGGQAVFTYQVGQVGYWAPGRALAVVYAVQGDGAIPSPA